MFARDPVRQGARGHTLCRARAHGAPGPKGRGASCLCSLILALLPAVHTVPVVPLKRLSHPLVLGIILVILKMKNRSERCRDSAGEQESQGSNQVCLKPSRWLWAVCERA